MMLVVVPTLVITSSAEPSLWIMLPFSYLGGHQAYLWNVQRNPWVCYMKGWKFWLTWIIWIEKMIGFTQSLEMSEKLQIYFFENTTFEWMYSLLFPFLPLSFLSFYLPPVCTALLIRGEVDSLNQIRFILGGYINFQFHLLFLQYRKHILSLCYLNRYGGLFPHSAMRCNLE